MASNVSAPNTAAEGKNHTNGIIQALGKAFQSQTGDALNNNQIAQLLQANIGQLDGKLSQQQILQVWAFYIRFFNAG